MAKRKAKQAPRVTEEGRRSGGGTAEEGEAAKEAISRLRRQKSELVSRLQELLYALAESRCPKNGSLGWWECAGCMRGENGHWASIGKQLKELACTCQSVEEKLVAV
jgi:hypothetical protein